MAQIIYHDARGADHVVNTTNDGARLWRRMRLVCAEATVFNDRREIIGGVTWDEPRDRWYRWLNQDGL